MTEYSRMVLIKQNSGEANRASQVNLALLIGEGNRQWIEPLYSNRLKPTPLTKDLKTIIPKGPNHPDMILDACIAFFPELFKNCPSLENVKSALKETLSCLDFDLGQQNIPKEWDKLREEARVVFKDISLITVKE